MDPKRFTPAETDNPVGVAARLDIPKLYANGFGTGFSATEIVVVPTLNNVPLASLALPPSVAKSLAATLLIQVARYEQVSGAPVPSVEELVKRFEAGNKR